MARKSIPHNGEAGFIAAINNPRTDLYIVLYDSKQAGFKGDCAKYTLFCAAHGSTCCETNVRRAKSLMKTPNFWCDGCEQIEDDGGWNEDLKVVPYDLKSPEEQDREMRILARMIKGDAEKAALFKAVYGINPDLYWD